MVIFAVDLGLFRSLCIGLAKTRQAIHKILVDQHGRPWSEYQWQRATGEALRVDEQKVKSLQMLADLLRVRRDVAVLLKRSIGAPVKESGHRVLDLRALNWRQRRRAC